MSQIRDIRMQLASTSVAKAALRLQKERLSYFQQKQNQVQKTFRLQASICQFAQSGMLVRQDLDPTEAYLAASSKNGTCKVWQTEQGKLLTQLRGHLDKVNDIKFNPRKQLSQKGPKIATASSDATIRLWSFQKQLLYQKSLVLSSHSDRVNRLLFFHHGALLLSTSNDCSFRLWDLCRGTALLEQRGHSNPVLAVALHPEQSLLWSSDVSSQIFLWDIRTGKLVKRLGKHEKILNAKFNPNCREVAAASQNNCIKILDIRKMSMHDIPGHTSSVTDILWKNDRLVSSSLDGSIRCWNDSNLQWSIMSGKVLSLSGGQRKMGCSNMNQSWQIYYVKQQSDDI